MRCHAPAIVTLPGCRVRRRALRSPCSGQAFTCLGPGPTLGAMRARWMVLGALAGILGAGCTSPPAGPGHAIRATVGSWCKNPTAMASTSDPVAVGAPGAPAVGPLSFHPYPYQNGYPTKMVIAAVVTQTATITLRGYRCSDARVLTFQYGQPLTSPPPLAAPQLAAAGVAAQALYPLAAGEGHTGYVLLTSAGRWIIEVRQGHRLYGTLLLDAVSSHAYSGGPLS
jgi:hypothetical protein